MRPGKKRILIIVCWFSGFVILTAGTVISINMHINSAYKRYIYRFENVPYRRAALVLGASVFRNGELSYILEDRVNKAMELYHQGKVKFFLLSGDHSQYYDEVSSMENYLLGKNISSDDIILDHFGYSTYDSIYRARYIFGIDSIVIVTQEYHLPRALYIARSLGIDAVGCAADYRNNERIGYYLDREKLANVKAFLDVFFRKKPEKRTLSINLNGIN